MQKKDITKRIIPLPRNIRVSKGVDYNISRIKIEYKGEKSPAVVTALKILYRFSNPGQINPDFIIRLRYINKNNDAKIHKQLKKAKNREQSYAITSNIKKGVYKSIELTAYSGTGLLYAVITLSQAIIKNGNSIYIPVLHITDWPEIAFRGQWGGNSNCDLHWTFQYKLNAIDGKVLVSADKEGKATIVHNERLYREAAAYGVDIMATIPHLEQISKRGFLEKRTDILNVPSEERKNRSDYFPGICMSNPATEQMICEWFKGIAGNKSVKKILVWLSEEVSPCYCELCNGEESFQMEVKCLLNAYKKMTKEITGVKLGIMLSQGSFEVTGKIAAMLPKDVSLTYYDGGRTYDSGKYPMITPVLEKYVKKGGKLGVYPQITHSWRMVFPWTAPYFIKYRCDEFVEKGLHRIIGYAIPSNRYHEFNLMAFAEWLWNPKGRKVKNFVAAYAFLNNIPEKSFIKYLKLMEEPAWQLAQSKLLLRLTYNYSLILRSKVDMKDHRYEMAEIMDIKNPGKLIKSAGKALVLAENMGEKAYIYESRCVIAGLKGYRNLSGFIREIDKQSINTEKLKKYYSELKISAADMRKNILKWNRLIIMENDIPMKRVIDTSMIFYRALDGFYRYFENTNTGVEKSPEIVTHLGEWDESVFDKDGSAVLEYDVTSYIKENGKGTYYISLDFTESESGTDINRVTLHERQIGGGEKPVAYVRADMKRISVWRPWSEYPIKIKAPGFYSEYILKIDIRGLLKNAKTCRGMTGIRKV